MIAELVSSALGLALYLNTLSADFCYDDSRAIKTNQDLLPETPWTHIFYNDFWGTLLTHSGSHKSYRPLCTLSFRLNHAIGGLNPWSYHLVNILLHAAVTGLFTSFSKILLGDGYWTFMAGLMFASHPIHTEAVAGIVGRADVGASLFFLLSLLCYIKHCSTRGYSARTWGWFLGTGLCAGCSMLWKEQGVTVLAVSAVYDVFVFHRLKMKQILPTIYKGKNLSLFLSMSLLTLWGTSLLGARLYWMGNKPPSFSNSDNPAADSDSLLARTLTFFYLPTKNLWLLLCPDTLSFDWSMDAVPLLKTICDWRNLHTVAFYIGLLLLAYCGLKSPSVESEYYGKFVTNGKQNANGHSCHSDVEYRNSEIKPSFASKVENGIKNNVPQTTPLPSTENIVVLSLSLLIIPFVPATNLFFYVGFVIAERVLYIPSMGFCLLITVGARALYVRVQKRFLKSLIFYATATLIVFYGLKTAIRNGDWQNEEMLYRSGIKVNPAKGEAYMRLSKLPEAEHWYMESLRSKTDHIPAHLTYGKLLALTGRKSEAEKFFLKAIELDPTKGNCYMHYGQFLLEEARLLEAAEMAKKAAELDSTEFDVVFNAAHMLRQASLNEAAEKYYDLAARLRPNYPAALMNLGAILHLNGRLHKAEANYLRALQLKPDDVITQSNLRKLWNIMEKQGLKTSKT
ncbi:transmembrane and TPR repeat-containing protein 2 isoform X4 [Myotis lucifugus]|uniref:transmembrane and TPR repeat-containing protein 2 isoform X4 n=1 Tax=Myotis lucifugus TaxID=59463 RepID=UPI000CCBDEC9|nr:transmembrane and TPR repeat-containing protein 2 isoform X4 [Myotis lucifugus]